MLWPQADMAVALINTSVMDDEDLRLGFIIGGDSRTMKLNHSVNHLWVWCCGEKPCKINVFLGA